MTEEAKQKRCCQVRILMAPGTNSELQMSVLAGSFDWPVVKNNLGFKEGRRKKTA